MLKSSLFILLLVMHFASAAQAAFINDKETFSGNIKDLSTWEEFIPNADSSITQNNGLTVISGADYTTQFSKVGIGESVRVTATDGPNSLLNIFLTTNSGGTTTFTDFDSSYIEISQAYFFDEGRSEFSALQGGLGTASGLVMGSIIEPVGIAHGLQITRLSSNLAEFTVFNIQGSSLFHTQLGINNIPDDLYISLSAGNAVFHDVSVVPEPSILAMLIIGLLVLTFLFRHRKFDKIT